MPEIKYPKVLILGNYHFEQKSGGGITITNLFKGWKKENLAIAVERIDSPDYSVCDNYYQLGSLECKQRFPFSLKSANGSPKSGIITQSGTETASVNHQPPPVSRIKKAYFNFMEDVGIVHYRNKLVLSESFLQWIRDFKPDVIYSMLSTMKLIEFMDELNSRLDIPIAIHIMDDWPNTIGSNQKWPFRTYWKSKIDRKFRRLLSRSQVLLSICDAMSEAYAVRYKRNFIPFHNPVNIEEWLPYSKTDWSTNNTFRILYTGRIGTANTNSILTICKAVGKINESEIKVKLDIFSQDARTEQAKINETFKGVEVKEVVPHKAIPSLLSDYDLLLLPLDFDSDGIRFARYSMPTKTSEYLISGTPILVFADKQTALARYAARENWAYVVSTNEESSIHDAILELKNNEELRQSLALKAKETAYKYEDSDMIRERFRKSFLIG
jgi:glycosyltransferase involved in cell wall biosynthesis